MPTLNWIGKEAVVKHQKDVPYRLLEPVPELSCGDSGSGNLIVQGDNLHALKALLPRYAGQVKCIYIDPPYNTGNESWVYNDNVNSPEIRKWLGQVVGGEGETLDRHDRWLSMIYPRLLLLRQFLREDGAIFVSLDDNEIQNLRAILDEIFGVSNFLATIIWQKRTSPDARLHIGPAHDYLVVYAKKLVSLKASLNKVRLSGERAKAFKNPDNDSRGPWASVDITGQTGHATPEQFYTITTPDGRLLKPPKGRCWAMAEKTVEDLIRDNRIWFGNSGKSRPRLKKFLSETEGMTTWTWWPNTEVGHNQEATKELNDIMQAADVFENPKPSRLIMRVFELATDKNSLILDSFAGSGTTGQAVLQLNRQDDGARHFILVEMDDNIAMNVTTERIRRVSQGYTNAKGERVKGLGSGFQFCKLSDEPLFTPDGQIRSDVTFAKLAEFVWFVETGTGIIGKTESPLIGIHEGRAVYLLYNGILKDKSVAGGNVLTRPVYESLPKFDGAKVIYAAACRLGAARLAREGVVFKQTPYALEI